MQCAAQIMNSFLALEILTPMPVAVKHKRLNSVTSEDFKLLLTLLVPPTCITEHGAFQKLGSVGLWSLSYPSSHMCIETNNMGWRGVQKCCFEPCLSQMLGAQEMPQLIGISWAQHPAVRQAVGDATQQPPSLSHWWSQPGWCVFMSPRTLTAVLSLLLAGGSLHCNWCWSWRNK